MSNGEGLGANPDEQSYVAYRRQKADAEWASLLRDRFQVELRPEGPVPTESLQMQVGPEMASRQPVMPPEATQKAGAIPMLPGAGEFGQVAPVEQAQPLGNILQPQTVLPAVGKVAGAVGRQPGAVAKGVAKGALGLPKEILQSLEDLSNWAQGLKDEEVGLSALVTGEKVPVKDPKKRAIHLIEQMIPGPGPSPEGVEATSRAVTSFGLAFLVTSGLAGVVLKGAGIAASAPKLAATLQGIAGPAGAAFVTEQGGISHKLLQAASARLPDEVKIPFADLLEADPNDEAAVRRFKAAVGNLIDVKAFTALVGIAKAMRVVEGGASGGVLPGTQRVPGIERRINLAGERGGPASPAPTIERRGQPVPVSPERRTAETEGIANLLSRPK